MNKKQELASFLISQGIVSPADQAAEIAKMAGQCPTALAAEKNLTTDEDKAYEVMLIQTGSANPAKGTAQNETAVTPGISAVEQTNIASVMLKEQENRMRVSESSAIDSYILAGPAPADIIPAGAVGEINKDAFEKLVGKVEAGELIVCPDDGDDVEASKRIASTTNWNALKKAFADKTPVEVYIGQLGKRPIGYVVRKGNANGTASQPVQLTSEELLQFMVLDGQGYIKSQGNQPGAKVKMISPKNSSTTPGATTAAKTVIADANKKAAMEAGLYQISREATSEKVQKTQKSALQVRFQVKGKTLSDGVTPKTVVKRVSVTTECFGFERKPEYVDKFGTVSRDGQNNLSETPDSKTAEKILKAQVNYIAELRRKAKDPNTMLSVAGIADQLKAFDGAATQAPNATI